MGFRSTKLGVCKGGTNRKTSLSGGGGFIYNCPDILPGEIMTLSPKDIVFPLEEPTPKDDLIRRFILNGYSAKRAKYHIREFIYMGLLFEENGIIDVEPAARERCRL